MTRISNVVARTIRLNAKIGNSVVNFSGLTASLVEIVAEDGRGEPLVGYGFGSIGRYAQTEMILDRFGPRLLEASPKEYCSDDGALDPWRMERLMRRNEKPGGHGERTVAIGAIDMAAWDLASKQAGMPLWRLLSNRFNGGRFDAQSSVYAAGGYYTANGDVEGLKREIEAYLEEGYEDVKIKIGGASLAEDLKRIEAVIELLGSGSRLAVDANGRFDRVGAISYAEALEPYGLRWYEEPGDPLDFELNRAVAERYSGSIATGENLFSVQDVRNALRYAGLRSERDVLQMDPALSYGIGEYTRMIDSLETRGWSRRSLFPHGGNLFNLHVAIGLQIGGSEVYPGVFEPLGGFGTATLVSGGKALAPATIGIGWEHLPSLMDLFADLRG